jgi:hypothetical protein
MQINKVYNLLSLVQGVYTLLTALWALVDIKSFMEVTGPKTDTWLVKTVAVVLLPIAVCFLWGLFFNSDRLLIIVVGIMSSAGLAFIDFYYTTNGTIKWIYQADGYLQLLFLLLWVFLFVRHTTFKKLS